MDAALAHRIAERFSKLSAEQRSSVYRKLREEGLTAAHLPILPLRRDAGATERVAASYAQARQWFLWQLEPDSTAYHIGVALRIRGALDEAAVRWGFESLVRRQEGLRTVFRADEDGAVEQVVQAAGSFGLEVVDLGGVEDAVLRGEQVLAHARDVSARPFDLEAGPLLRVALIRETAGEHVLVVVMHHIVSDGWSMQIVLDEFVAQYEARVKGGQAELRALEVQYGDYAVWQRNWLEAGERERQLGYWRAQLGATGAGAEAGTQAGAEVVLELPVDHARRAQGNYTGAQSTRALPVALVAGLQQRAQGQGATLFMVLLAGFMTLLQRYAGQEEIRVGVPVANRQRAEIEAVVGLFVNTQVLRNRITGRQSLSQVLAQTREAALGAQAHQDLPFEQLVEALQPQRRLGHSPLFQVMFNHQRQDHRSLERLAGLEMESLELGGQQAQFELSVDTVEEADGSVSVSATYAAELFDASTIGRMMGHYVAVLEALAWSPEQAVADVRLLDDAQREALLQWGENRTRHDGTQPVHALFERQVEVRPDAVALVYGDTQLSYRELNEAANRVAHELIARGVGPEVKVGLALERGIGMAVGVLGVLKSGGAYVPLDPQYPAERLSQMMEDSGLRVVLCESALRAQLPQVKGVDFIALDTLDLSSRAVHNPGVPLHGGNLAYQIYTSGSTGRPKGIGITHAALAEHSLVAADCFGLVPGERMLQFSTINFDGFIDQFFAPLAVGAAVVLRGPTLWDSGTFYREVIERGISVADLPTAYWHLLAQDFARHGERDYGALRQVQATGEAMPPEGVKAWREAGLAHVRLLNTYGPTETVVTATAHDCAAYIDGREALPVQMPVGRPLAGRHVYVLDADLTLAPVGVAGELYIGGELLARGYHGRAGLSAERFVADPFSGGEGQKQGGRLYRTGDVVRWNARGELEYLGRTDHQVKVRGFRIELGEIEAQLLAQPGVREAVVVARHGAGGAKLVGYVSMQGDHAADALAEPRTDAPADPTGITAKLHASLAAVLPDYMVPSALMVLASLPLNANGKVDRHALPEPDTTPDAGYEAPQGEVEEALAQIWSEVLAVEKISRHDNFFELGGDSIISLQMVSALRRAGWHITPKQVFERQCIAQLAAVTQSEHVSPTRSPSQTDGDIPFLPIQIDFFAQNIPVRHHWNQAMLLHTQRPLDIGQLANALAAVVEHHNSFRIRYRESAEGCWHQRYETPTGDRSDPLLWVRKAADAGEIERLCAEAQRSLNLSEGPLIRALVIEVDDGSWRLLLAIHHLIVDGISWRVLLEDLQTAYGQCCAAQPVLLPAVTHSYKDWALALQDYAARHDEELAYWQAALADVPVELPCTSPDGENIERWREDVTVSFDRPTTQALLKQAPVAYRTQINDILLTALGRALCDWSGHQTIAIELEGHGREDFFTGVDVSRTVGWFTAVFPVRLDPLGELGAALKRVKESLRGIPNRGVGFGALKYTGSATQRQALSAIRRPHVVFNYLGQFDGAVNEAAPWYPSNESTGGVCDGSAPLEAELSINGHIGDGELTVTLTYSRMRYSARHIQTLMARFRHELHALVEHCGNGEKGVTPSDFPLAALTQTQLDELPVAPGAMLDLYPLTPMQAGMLFHTEHDQHGHAYVEQRVFDIDDLDVERFRAAWQACVASHDVLRTGFVHVGDASLQWTARHAELPFDFHDLHDFHELHALCDLETALDELSAAEVARGFDLFRPPLMRITLVRTSASRHRFIWTTHHVLFDGWSTAHLLSEVLRRYAGESVPVAGARYRDYIEWLQQRDPLAGEAFWRRRVAGLAEPTRLADSLPYGRSDRAGAFGTYRVELDSAACARLEHLAKREHVTLATIFQGAWALLLARYCGQQTVSFGATVAGRPSDLPGADTMLGLFINTLPQIVSIQPERAVAEWLGEMQQQSLDARDYEYTPLYDIQRWAGVGGQGLFDTLLVFENYPVDKALREAQVDGLKFREVGHHEETNYPMSVGVTLAGTVHLKFDYACDFFDEVAVRDIAQQMVQLLMGLTESAFLHEVGLVTDATREQLLRWGENRTRYDGTQPVHGLFEQQAEVRPDAVALIYGDTQLSYAELNEAANRVAHELIARGVGPEVKVGLALERGIGMAVGVLGVLKAGGAYVPLDPQYPAERLSQMMEDSGLRVVLCESALRAQLPQVKGVDFIALDTLDLSSRAVHNPGVPLHGGNLAYQIYTSGSTGLPKGIGITHAALAEHSQVAVDCFGLVPGERMLQFSTINFDAFIEQFFTPLILGASMVLRGPTLWDSGTFYREVIERDISVVHLPTAYWHLLAQDFAQQAPRDYGRLRQMRIGGEAMPPEGVKAWREAGLAHVRLLNTYGPTEAVVTATSHDCAAYIDGRESLPVQMRVGRPLAGRHVYVLDADLNLAPVGVAGELYIGGVLLARGYHGRAGLSAERFVADPFAREEQGGRLYRTGDVVRWNARGELEYLGRTDHQVKVRGFRIELGEIEAQLLAQPGVREAVVVARQGAGGAKLVGYVSMQADHAAEAPEEVKAKLHASLAAVLPDYMVPSALMVLASLPLNANGKVDRHALPEPHITQEAGYEAPHGEVEEALAQIWSEVLEVDKISRHDNFFELGGHSLLAIRVLERLHRGGWRLEMRTLFQHPRIADLARIIAESGVDGAETGEIAIPPNGIAEGCQVITPKMVTLIDLDPAQIRTIEEAVPGGARNIQDIYPLVPLQEGILFHHLLMERGDVYVTPCLLSFPAEAELQRFLSCLDQLIARHDILRTAVLWEGLPEPVQVVWRHSPLQLTWLPQPSSNEKAAGTSVATRLNAYVDPTHYRIDVQSAPMIRAIAAYDPQRGRWLLQLPSHHLILDHTTQELLIEEIALLQQGRHDELTPPVPFRDFVARGRLGVTRAEHEAFFRDMLDGVNEPTAPYGLVDVRGSGERVTVLRVALDDALAKQVYRQAQRKGVSAAALFHLAWAIVLARTTGRDDVVFGTVLFGRMQSGAGVERAMGMFINTLPVRIRLRDLRIAQSIERTHSALSALLHHEHCSLSLAQRCSALPGDTPLFSTLFNYRYGSRQKSDAMPSSWDGIEVEDGDDLTNYPISISVDDLGDGFELEAQVIEPCDASQICAYVQAALAEIVDASSTGLSRPVGEVEVLDGVQRDALLQWGENRTRHDGTQPVHALFERQVEVRPDAVALVYGDTQLSYRELNEAANRVAHELIARGVGPEVKIGLALERGIGMAVGVLAVLKSGGAYVPLDPQYPAERLSQMMEDSGLRVVLCESGLAAQLPQKEDVTLIALDTLDLSSHPVHNPGVPLHGGNLAYQIYTSGSTGRPKGIGITHAALAEHSLVAADCFGLVPGERMLQFSTINFDGFIDQFFAPLAAGAAVVLRGPTLWDSGTFYREVIERGISVADLPTAYWHLLAQDFARHGERDYGALRQVQATGEAMPPEGVKAWREAGLAHVRLLNTYGPTETVVTATAHDCAAYIDGREALPVQMPVGRPLAGRHVYVLDAELNLAPVGVAGELYIGGELLARGYHGRAGLSAERFVADPFAGGEGQKQGGRLYRTGDVVRWNARGELEYLGRTDHQVKVRGFRIELGEIEAQLLAQPGVREAVVVARHGAGGAKLVGYVSMQGDHAADALAEPRTDAPADPTGITAKLHASLAAVLPDYMVPSALMVLASLPLNANGKVDRHALPEPDTTPDAGYEAPQGEVEEALAQIWSEVLAVEKIGRHDNFFELGGHSLLALKLVDRIQRRVGKTTFVISDIFSFPDLCGQAVRMDANQAADHTADLGVVVLNREGKGMPLYCFTGIYGNTDEFASLARALAADRPVYGFICHTLTRDRLNVKTFTELAQERARYIAATAPRGRCGIVGWCKGGDLAYETARVLAGEVEVAMLGMVDLSDRVETSRRFDKFESAGAGDTKNPLPETLTTWLAESAMRQSWLDFFERLDWRERRLAFSSLGELNEPLPVDGPSLSSREFDLWVVMSLIWMEHRLKLDEGAKVPVRVWTAEATLDNPALICRQWSSFTHVEAGMLIPGATHRSILDHPDFLDDVRQSLLTADREPSAASSPAPLKHEPKR